MKRVLKIAIILCFTRSLFAAPRLQVGPGKTYSDIQSAIDDASNGYYIEVYADTYTIDTPIDFDGKGVRVYSVDGSDDTTIEMSNPANSNDACVVKFNSSEDGTSKLIGFTITGGQGRTNNNQLCGGGIYIYDAGPQITNCIIEENSADIGAGVFAYQPESSFELDNCTVKNNDSNNANPHAYEISLDDGAGIITECTVLNEELENGDNHPFDNNALGGIYLEDMSSSFTLEESTIKFNNGSGVKCLRSDVEISDCTIKENKTDEHGGGIFCSDASPTITNCDIIENKADDDADGYDGGGIYCWDDSSPEITNCTISRNETGNDEDGHGGGIFCANKCSPTIKKCIISENKNLDGFGGGIYCNDESSPTITNSLIVLNECGTEPDTATEGGGIYCYDDSNPTLFNCTISDNDADASQELYWENDTTATEIVLRNCIVWDNFNVDEPYYLSGNGGDGDIDFSDLHDYADVDDNIAVDPEFVDPANGDYHLCEDSPCIDKGTDTDAPSTDLDGRDRPCDIPNKGNDSPNDTTDMGAYEFCETTDFYRGDVNDDGIVNVADVIAINTYLTGGSINCKDSADVNDDGAITSSDSTYLLDYIYTSGPNPKDPFTSCGTDPTGDALTCGSFDDC